LSIIYIVRVIDGVRQFWVMWCRSDGHL